MTVSMEVNESHAEVIMPKRWLFAHPFSPAGTRIFLLQRQKFLPPRSDAANSYWLTKPSELRDVPHGEKGWAS